MTPHLHGEESQVTWSIVCMSLAPHRLGPEIGPNLWGAKNFSRIKLVM